MPNSIISEGKNIYYIDRFNFYTLIHLQIDTGGFEGNIN